MLGIFENAFQDANFEIVNVVTISIEMQWQRKKLFMTDRVYVFNKSVSEFYASLYIYIYDDTKNVLNDLRNTAYSIRGIGLSKINQ